MASLNRVTVIGNLTRDIELRYTPAGSPVTTIGLAVNRNFKKKDSDEKQQETCFVNVNVWGSLAENCSKYLQKGDPILVEGRLTFREWDDKESGKKRSALDVTAENIQFLKQKGDNQCAPNQEETVTAQQVDLDV